MAIVNLQSSSKHISIALVAPFPPPYDGGMGVRFQQMALCLEREGIAVERVQLISSTSRFLRLLSFLFVAPSIIKLKSKTIHVVSGSIPNFLALAPIFLVAKVFRRNTILSIGGGFWEREASSFSARSKIVRSLLKLQDKVVCCNRSMVTAVVSLGVPQEKVVFISNALPDEISTRDQMPLPDDFLTIRNRADKVLLYVGAILPWYGLLETLNMFASLRTEENNYELIALVTSVSDKQYFSSVLEIAKVLNLDDSFHIYTSVPWAVSAMVQSDLVIRATTTIEGDSRAVREALSVGTPVIASNICPRPEGVFLFSMGNIESMKLAAQSALKHSTIVHSAKNNFEGTDNITKILTIYSSFAKQ